MSWFTKSSTSILGLAVATHAMAAEASGVAPSAAVLHDFGHGWRLTNAMLTGFAGSLFIVFLIVVLVGRPKIFPSKGQAVMESIIEALRDLFEPIVGKKAFPAAFPVLICMFIFILVNNWSGLIPGVGTIGWGHDVDGHFEIVRPLIRPFSSDFNGTLALAGVSTLAWFFIVLKYTGPKAIMIDLFGNKATRSETPLPLYIALSVIFVLVGCIEVFSIAIRPFTLSVRLFGNVFGGENLLHGTGFFPVFYFMEMLVGLIQATVFTLLSAVYIGLLCNHGDDHAHADDDHAAAAHH